MRWLLIQPGLFIALIKNQDLAIMMRRSIVFGSAPYPGTFQDQ